MNWKLVLLVFIFIFISSSFVIKASAESYTNVFVSEAKTMIRSNPSLVILDVRTQSEYDEGHIRNAKLIPHTELEGRLDELNKTDEILVYCRLGGRSATASQLLVDNGFLYVYNMLGGITEWIVEGYPVYVNYSSIQEAINNASEGDTIFVSSGLYYEHLIVNKSVTIIGENRETTILDGNNTETTIQIKTDNFSISSFTIRESGCCGNAGIHIKSGYQNVKILNSRIIQNAYGIKLDGARDILIIRNNLINNSFGIDALHSLNVSIRENVLTNHFSGITLYNSTNSVVSGNTILNNNFGIYISYSNDNTFRMNTITLSNFTGIFLGQSNNNVFFHNNVVENVEQTNSYNQVNIWDNGAEGNYWSDYSGVDINHDGIGGSWHEIDQNNTDYYPLMGIFHSFNTSLGKYVNIISNSTIENFEYFKSNSTIKTHVSNITTAQTFGFCRACIPHDLMNPENIWVVINEGQTEALFTNFTLYDNGTHRWIYFAYSHSTHEIVFGEDRVPPSIENVYQQPDEDDVYPDDKVEVYVNVTDDMSGIKQVTLNYTIDNGTWFSTAMTNLEGNLYNATIPPFSYCTNVTYVIMAEDNANNTITTEEMGYEYQYHVISELPSSIITSLYLITTLLIVLILKRKHVRFRI